MCDGNSESGNSNSSAGSNTSNAPTGPVNDRDTFSGTAQGLIGDAETAATGIGTLADQFGQTNAAQAAKNLSKGFNTLGIAVDALSTTNDIIAGDKGVFAGLFGFGARRATQGIQGAIEAVDTFGPITGFALSEQFGFNFASQLEDNAIQRGQQLDNAINRAGVDALSRLGPNPDAAAIDEAARDHFGTVFPIILDLDDDGFELIGLDRSTAFFDVDDDDFFENTGWLSSDDGFLVTDIDGDGKISSASELAISLQTDAEDTDLEAFAELYDTDENGIFDENDSAWNSVFVWRDLDQDGFDDSGELRTLEDMGLASINLTLTPTPESERYVEGNQVHYTSGFTRVDGSNGQVGDVALAHSNSGYRFTSNADGVELQLEEDGGSALIASDSGLAIHADLAALNYVAAFGSDLEDILFTNGDANVQISGAGGNDTITGGVGNDWLAGGAGSDAISGGAGHDVLFVDELDAAIDGGSGADVVIVSTDLGVTLDLTTTNIEAAQGNSGADHFFLSAAGANETENYGVVLDGRDGDDVLSGGAGDDIIAGGEGADIIQGGDGNDTLVVDSADDYDAGDGEDTVWYLGEEDLDINVTTRNAEIFFSGQGNDTITTDQRHAAALHGGAGNDVLSGGWGADFLNGGQDNDLLKGGYGSDSYFFNIGSGHDRIEDSYVHSYESYQWYRTFDETGEVGHYRWNQNFYSVSEEQDAGETDVLSFGTGISAADLVFRVDGDDLQIAIKADDTPFTDFEALADRVTIADWLSEKRKIEELQFDNGSRYDLRVLLAEFADGLDNAPVDLGVAMATLYETGAPGDVLGGTSQDDRVGGTDASEIIVAGAGDDRLIGSAGNDLLIGGDGEDTVSYANSEASVTADLSLENTELWTAQTSAAGDGSDSGNDEPRDFSDGDTYIEIENIDGSAFDDTLTGDDTVNKLDGAAGNDALSGLGGDDTLAGGLGDDTLEGGAGADVLEGGEGSDTASYAGAATAVTIDLGAATQSGGDAQGDSFVDIENAEGSGFDDTLVGDGNDNRLLGLAGADLLQGGEGDDFLDGGAGNDALEGGIGDDVYAFGRGSGVDTVVDQGLVTRLETRQETYTYYGTKAVWIGGGEGGYWGTTQVAYTGTRTVEQEVEVAGYSGRDTVLLGSGISVDDVLIRLNGDVLEIALKDAAAPDALFDSLADKIALTGWSHPDTRIDVLEFESGTRLDLPGLVSAFGVVDGGPVLVLDEAMAAQHVADVVYDEILAGGDGEDVLVAGDDGSELVGGGGNDDLQGGDGDDHLAGGPGDDQLSGGAGADVIDGGEGNDTADYAGSEDGVTVTLDDGSGQGTGTGGDAEGDTITNVENLSGSGHDDALTGDGGDNTIQGQGGDDALDGAGGDDTLAGGEGDDVIAGGAGADQIDGGGGTDTADYGNSDSGVTVDLEAGNNTGGDAEGDTLTGIENVTGSAHDDTLTGDGTNNTLDGSGGNDHIESGAGDDRILAGTGADYMAGGSGDDTYVFGRGAGAETLLDEHLEEQEFTRREAYTAYRQVNVNSGEGGAVWATQAYTAYRDVSYTEMVEVDAGADILSFGEGIAATDLVIERIGNDLVVGIADPDDPGKPLAALADRITLTDWFDSNNRIEIFGFADGTYVAVRDIIGFLATAGDDVLTWTETAAYIDGGAGADALTAGEFADRLSGGDGNDTITSADGDDTLAGNAGDDVLDGGAGADVYLFGFGDGRDTIHDASGANTVRFADGVTEADVAFVLNGADLTVTLTAEDVLTVVGWGDATVSQYTFELSNGSPLPVLFYSSGTAGDDALTGTIDNDAILAGAGNDTVDGLEGHDILRGEDGDDVLKGGVGNDTLIGGVGSDDLQGGQGDDTYKFGRGDGLDVVLDEHRYTATNSYVESYTAYNQVNRLVNGELVVVSVPYTATRTVTEEYEAHDAAGSDVLAFGPGITAQDLRVERTGNDLVVGVVDTADPDTPFLNIADKVTLTNWFDSRDRIETFVFADGASLTTAQIVGLFATASDDTLTFNDLPVDIDGGLGADTITSGDSDDVLLGGDGDDTLSAGLGNDTLDGGSGTDDLDGGDGNDTYIFGFGYGNDTVTDASGTNVVKFAETVQHSDIIFLPDGSDLVVRLSDDDTLRVVGGNDQGVSQFSFTLHDGTVVPVSLTVPGTAGDDQIAGTDFKDYLTGAAGNDVIEAADGDDQLFGGSGDDVLRGQVGNDEVVGGTGNDTLEGGAGNDVYSFARGDGSDIITDYAENTETRTRIESYTGTRKAYRYNGESYSYEAYTQSYTGYRSVEYEQIEQVSGGRDVLEFGAGVTLHHLIFKRDGDDLVIGVRSDGDLATTDFAAVGDQIRITGWSDGRSQIEVLQLDDGSQVWLPLLVSEYNLLEDGTVLDLNAVMAAVDHSATGVDTVITGTTWRDVLYAAPGTNAYLAGFLENDYLVGNDGNDTLDGEAGNDYLDGGTGNDLLIGGGGDDIYHFDLGSGQDTIRHSDGAGRVTLGASIVADDVTFTRAGDDLEVGFVGAPDDQITVEGWFTDSANQVTFELSNGTEVPANVGSGNASDGGFSTDEDNAVTIAAATLLSGGVSTIQSVQDAVNGSVSLDVNGDVVFTPSGDYNGTASFTYTTFDGNGGTSVAQVDLTINAVNDAPDAVADSSFSAEEDSAVTIAAATLLTNDTDVDGDTLTIQSVQDAVNGTVTLNGSGAAVFTPSTDHNGSASFTYTVSDGYGGTSTAQVDLTINAVNDGPVAVTDDGFSTDEDSFTIISASVLLTGDLDVDGDTLSIQSVQDAVNGSVALDVNGDVVFTPSADYYGPATFTYTVSDGNGGTSTATVSLTVNPVNDVPVTVDDVGVVTQEDAAVTIAASTLLANDTDVEGDLLTIQSVQDAANGTVALDTNGDVVFTPTADYNGPASFTYTVSDNNGETSTATVSLTVNPVSDVPVVVNDGGIVTREDVAVTIAAATLLANDTDADGDTLTIQSVQGGVNGTVALDVNGDAVFTPTAGYNGPASFTYTVADGNGGTSTGQVDLSVTAVNLITGTAGDDNLTGTAGDDRIEGGAGIDRLYAEAGNDVVVAGDGDDSVWGADGDDEIDLGAGVDYGTGGAGNDVLFGEAGADRLEGGIGNDRLYGGADNDVLVGEDGDDSAFGGDGDDELKLGAGADYGAGGAGNDNLSGNAGIDRLEGGIGNDRIYGGAGNDALVGEDGDDSVWGEDGDDVIELGAGADYGTGGAGNDDLFGGAGIDWLEGGVGNDRIYAGADNDTILGEDGDDYGFGQGGDDRIELGAGVDYGTGGDGNDTLEGGAGNDRLEGDAGNDTLTGGTGNDVLVGGAGSDTYTFGAGDGADTIDNNGASTGSTDVLEFGGVIDKNDLWFAQVDNDLVVSLLGTQDEVTVDNWYDSADNQLDQIVDSGGTTLDAANVQQLVAAMATFQPNDGTDATGVLPDQLPTDVQVAVDSAWQTSTP